MGVAEGGLHSGRQERWRGLGRGGGRRENRMVLRRKGRECGLGRRVPLGRTGGCGLGFGGTGAGETFGARRACGKARGQIFLPAFCCTQLKWLVRGDMGGKENETDWVAFTRRPRRMYSGGTSASSGATARIAS
jgi:hypothetical protein